MTTAVAIFAHQEEKRIGLCLGSLPLDRADTRFHVLVNGSTDATAERAREAAGGRANVIVHDLAEGGKARTWNRFVHDLLTGDEEAVIFLDGDAQIGPNSIDALVAQIAARPDINAASGLPGNGRTAQAYRESLRTKGGLFGDLYALSGAFVRKVRARGLRLPDDLVGDDGLVAAWAHTDLQSDAAWDTSRIAACEGACFLSETVRLTRPATLIMHYRRMINYSVRHFQNRIVSDIMKREGPDGLPARLSSLYGQWLPRFQPRPGVTGWFDRKALARMREAIQP